VGAYLKAVFPSLNASLYPPAGACFSILVLPALLPSDNLAIIEQGKPRRESNCLPPAFQTTPLRAYAMRFEQTRKQTTTHALSSLDTRARPGSTESLSLHMPLPEEACRSEVPPAPAAMRSLRILILDNVIVNAGDAAIMLAMKESLQEAFGSGTLIYNGLNGPVLDPDLYQRLYPELHFVATPTNAAYNWPQPGYHLWRRLVRKTALARFRLQAHLHRLGLPLSVLLPKERALFHVYAAADLIIVTGGACLSTSWTPPHQRAERATKYQIALMLNKPLVFYAQSIGPFLPADPLPEMLRPIMERADAILCRDAESVQVVRERIGVTAENVYQTIDEALLLTPRAPSAPLMPPKARALRIGLCVHQWHWLGAEDPQARQRAFEARIVEVCQALLARHDAELLFLTTHQGVEGIPRDDEVSLRLCAQLPEALRHRAHVLTEFVHPREFAYLMGQCDLVISSRLHGAVLSLVGGTPILALAYEPKTSGLMRQIHLEDCVLSMWESDADEIQAKAEEMLGDLPQTRHRHQEALELGRRLARRNREIVVEVMRRRTGLK